MPTSITSTWTSWSHFPNVSLVLHDAWLLGSHSPTDTLLKAHELSVACNALQLIGGNYELTALDVSNASLSMASNSNGWNTQVWDAGNGDADKARICHRPVGAHGRSAGHRRTDHQGGSGRTAIELDRDRAPCHGSGRCASMRATDFATTEPLTWSAEVDWNTAEDTAHVSISSLQWLGVEASTSHTKR